MAVSMAMSLPLRMASKNAVALESWSVMLPPSRSSRRLRRRLPGHLPERLGQAVDLPGFVVVGETDPNHPARLRQAESSHQLVGIVVAIPDCDAAFTQL